MQKSPLRDRLFVVVDSVHPRGLQAELVQMGLPSDNFVVWSRNGIEYIYPMEIMRLIFSCTENDLAALEIKDDVVELNGISKRKKDLCREVVRGIGPNTPLPQELESGLLSKLTKAIG